MKWQKFPIKGLGLPLFQRFSGRAIALSCVFSVTILSGCSSSSSTLRLSSGYAGSYKQLGEQLTRSMQVVGDTALVDAYDSQGSLQNLQRLLDHQTDFALVQLDVASDAMKKGQVQAMVVLANEYLHVISRKESAIRSFVDLQGKRVAIGAPGSGIYFTASRLFQATNLKIREDQSSFDEAFQKLKRGQVDAMIYVGTLGTSQKLKAQLAENPDLQFVPVKASLTSYLTVQSPESYRAAVIPSGTYSPLPAKPETDVPTLSTATALVTRPDVDRQTVALLTWSILSTSRQYAPFYPQLATGEAKSLLQAGLVYVHPGTQQAFDQGDPRSAWVRYLQENKPLQAATIMLLSTSTIGFFLRRWRKRRSETLIKSTRKAISEVRSLLQDNPQQALQNVEALRQQQRLLLIDGAMTADIYEQVERMTQILAEQCRSWQEQQRQASIQTTLTLVEEWQASFRTNPNHALEQLGQVEAHYREMLLTEQVDIPTYLQLRQLILLSLMHSFPQPAMVKVKIDAPSIVGDATNRSADSSL